MDIATQAIDYFKSHVTIFFAGLLTVFVLFIRTFVQEKAKLKALQSENKKLVNDTESIKAQYIRQLEELKKEHQLDIARRKYQYESKKDQYIKFFQLLDKFTRDNQAKNQEQLMLILDEFNRNYLHAASQNNNKKMTEATVAMSKKIQKMTFESSQELIKIKQETNTIKLIASDQILEKLLLLEYSYDKASEIGNTMMSNLPKLMATNNQVQMQKDQESISKAGGVISQIRDEIISMMRIELNEI